MGRFIFMSFGLLVVFLSLSGTAADCPPDWSPYEGHCYKLFIQKLKWADAEQCSSNWSDGSCVCYENLVERRMKKCFVLEGREEPAGMNCSQHPPNGGHGCVPTLCPDLHPGRETGMAQCPDSDMGTTSSLCGCTSGSPFWAWATNN